MQHEYLRYYQIDQLADKAALIIDNHFYQAYL